MKAPKLPINGFKNITKMPTMQETLASGKNQLVEFSAKTSDNCTIVLEQKAKNIWLLYSGFQVIGYSTSFKAGIWYINNAPIYTLDELYTLARGKKN